MEMKVLCCVLLVGLLAVVVSAQRGPECPVCERTACEKVSEESCPAGVLLDECGCCQICGRKLDQNCGGKFWNLGRCGRDYFCSGPHPGKAINIGKGEVGFCMCRENKRVCGNDGIVYENFCSLNESSHEQREYGGNKIEVSRDRKICRSGKVLILDLFDLYNTNHFYCHQQGRLICWQHGDEIGTTQVYQSDTLLGLCSNHEKCPAPMTKCPSHYERDELSWVVINVSEHYPPYISPYIFLVIENCETLLTDGDKNPPKVYHARHK